MKPIHAPCVEFRAGWTLDAAPERVFPLLCPVLEYDWIATWQCEMVNTLSGVAEEDCIFRTAFPGGGEMTWITTRYEPNRAIDYTGFVAGSHIMRLKINLEAAGSGQTRLEWTRRFIALTPAGADFVAAYTPEKHETMMSGLHASLTHFLAAGKCLR
jgi:hypothetical protein